MGRGQKLTDEDLQATIAAVCEHGGATAAARALGLKRLTLQKHLKIARDRGLTVPDVRKGGKLPASPAPAVLSAEELVHRHIYIVKKHAAKLSQATSGKASFDDLYAVGLQGLWEAAKKFDPSRGVKFSTYCVLRVGGQMRDWLRQHDHVSRRTRQLDAQRTRIVESLEQQLGRSASEEEISVAVAWSAEQQRFATPARQRSFDEVLLNVDDHRSMRLYDLLAERPRGEELTHKQEAELHELVRPLNYREQVIIFLYYACGVPMWQIGELLGLSESRISQANSAALAYLNKWLRDSRQLRA